MTFVFSSIESSPKEKNSSKLSTTGKVLIGITGGVAVALTAICSSFVSPALRKICLPYVPATDLQIKNVMEALRGSKGKLIDLGSGDGRIVLEAAKNNFEAHGVELNFWLVLFSKLSIYRQNFTHKPQFFCTDLWKFSLAPYNNIVIFGVEEMMKDLENKIEKEVKLGSKIVACRFPLPNWEPITTLGTGVDTVWVYLKK
ncbi:ATP synthase subunit C lysine N-methyltransferase-like [Chrysoperla carnea]|uniref:ATP synthase subunit C lysine N-methyltransferase-like n=1 Tax=Chrysoperla carnea TaxID=189513 RepID=UPI001D0784F1|nr:ATP synthase subunit C lysine N-methyltransferase-like [Chrysoperla carnea]XP_044743796.1 ATP synthase subunit C lysine N-methyltransferase-like [Chrysoperla carnea]